MTHQPRICGAKLTITCTPDTRAHTRRPPQGDDAGEIEDHFDAWKERAWARLHGSGADGEGVVVDGEAAQPQAKREAKTIALEDLVPPPTIPVNLHEVRESER